MDPLVFETFVLAEFSDADVATYVHNWFTHVEGTGEQVARSLTESFISESAAVPELRKNPLMLALMCIIYRGQQWIPRNRPDMYEHCANLLFDKWDSSRQIFVELKAKAYVDAAIKHLAFWMFTESAGSQGVTETALIKEAISFLGPAFDSRVETESAARQFVEFCRGRAWVLNDAGTTADGESLFAFTHRTFMEYFAAYELTRRHDGPENVAKAILPHVAAAEWEIVAELSVQISNKHSRDGAARVLDALLGDRRYHSFASRKNISSFAFRCLGFVHVPIPLAVRIASAYAESILRFGVGTQLREIEPSRAVPDLQHPVEQEILSVLSSYIAGNDEAMKAVAIEIALELPRLMTGLDHARVQFSRHSFDRWTLHQQKIFNELGSEILSKRDNIIWFSAWRKNLISLEKLLREGPRAGRYPLEILFVDTQYRHLQHGWGEWGTFMPERLLQSGADTIEGFPASTEELTWLAIFIEQLPPPPWVTASAVTASLGRGFDGDLLVSKLETNYGWALLLLMLTAIEIEGIVSRFEAYPEPSRKYYAAVGALARRRGSGQALPQWLAEAIENLPSERRKLVRSWLNNDVNFVLIDHADE